MVAEYRHNTQEEHSRYYKQKQNMNAAIACPGMLNQTNCNENVYRYTSKEYNYTSYF